MKLSIHICNIPCPEEYYMGVNSSYEARIIEIPDENIPKDLMNIMKGEIKNKSITNIAIVK